MSRGMTQRDDFERSDFDAVKLPKGIFAESATAFDDEAPAPRILFDAEEITKACAEEILAYGQQEVEEERHCNLRT